MSLLDVLRGVMLDPAEQAAYNADPRAYLEQYGYDDVDPADLSEAFGLVADTLPPDQAQAALSAATEHDASTFGTVTQDFDGDGIDAAVGGAGAADVADALDDPAGEAADPADVDADADADGGVGPTLSFGEGDDGATDIDDPIFGESARTDGDSGLDDGSGTDVQDADAEVGESAGTGDDADLDDFDSGFDGGGFDDDLADGLGDSDDDGLSRVDDSDDGGVEEFDDAGPDDLDIGSF